MRKILIVLTIIGVLAGGYAALRNDLAELNHREVEITVDFSDVQALAREAVVTDREMLTSLRSLGATAVGLREVPITRYRREGSVAVATGGEVLNNWRLTGQAHPRLAELIERDEFQPDAVYLLTGDLQLAERITDKARLKFKKPVRSFLTAAPYVVEIAEDVSRVLSLRVGLDPGDIALAEELGLRVVARLDNQFLKDEDAVRETLDEFFSLRRGLLSAVVFEGQEVTGFFRYLDQTAAALKWAGLPFGIIEYNPQQAGTARLAALTNYSTVLVHSNWPNETVPSIVNSVRERRVRLLYVRFNLNDPDVLKNGTALFTGVVESLNNHGYRGGTAATIPYAVPGLRLLLVMFAGLAAAAALLLGEIFRYWRRPLWAVVILGFFGLLAAYRLLTPNLTQQLASILAAVVFSSLAVITQQLNRVPKKPKSETSSFVFALLALVRTFLVAAAGGALVLGLTSSPYFVSGTALFRGVKIVHALPILIIGFAALLRIYYHNRRRWTARDILDLGRGFLSQPVLVAYLIFLLAFAVLAYVYLGRTGHRAGVPVPALEVQMRVFLGEFLAVRPRIKEFLIGYPLALLGLGILGRGYRGPLTTALITFGAIGPVSMVNTFMHFTTPMYNTLLRSFNGLWLGVLLGTLLLAAIFVIARLADWVAKT